MSRDTQTNPLPRDPILQTPLPIHTTSGVSSLDDPQVWQPSPQHPTSPSYTEEALQCKAGGVTPTPALSSPMTSKLRDMKAYNLKYTKVRRHQSPPLGLGHCTRQDHPQQPQQIGEKNLRCSNLHELLLQTEAPLHLMHITSCSPPAR